jgi:hypothetical protein
MAISIDYITYIISVPKADTVFVETNPLTGLEIRELNIDVFGKALADLQDDPEGAWAETAYSYTPPAAIGGIQLAPVLLILEPYTITFEDLQYAVNLVGGNTNIQDHVNVNQVSIRPNNSAGNTFSDAVNSQSFINATVYIDTVGDGEAGVNFPIGTPPRPSDNYTDAMSIASREKLDKFHLHGTLVFSNLLDISNNNFKGDSPLIAVNIFSNTNIESCTFSKMGLTGSYTGRASFEVCSFSNTTGVQGIHDSCGFKDTVTLSSSATENILFRECTSVVAGVNKAIFNCNGTLAPIHFRGWVGGMKVTNFTGGGNMSIDVHSGSVEIDSTCTAGTIVVRGIGELIDNSGAGCTVVSIGFNPGTASISPADKTDIIDGVWDKDKTLHNGSDTFGKAMQDIDEAVKIIKSLSYLNIK